MEVSKRLRANIQSELSAYNKRVRRASDTIDKRIDSYIERAESKKIVDNLRKMQSALPPVMKINDFLSSINTEKELKKIRNLLKKATHENLTNFSQDTSRLYTLFDKEVSKVLAPIIEERRRPKKDAIEKLTTKDYEPTLSMPTKVTPESIIKNTAEGKIGSRTFVMLDKIENSRNNQKINETYKKNLLNRLMSMGAPTRVVEAINFIDAKTLGFIGSLEDKVFIDRSDSGNTPDSDYDVSEYEEGHIPMDKMDEFNDYLTMVIGLIKKVGIQ